MEQHPVPQNVTTFQFRLIGDMTIKQFGYLAGGAILAYITYKLPLPFFFTWPGAVLFALLGFGFAFVPVEERPMDVWVFSFIKSIYNPTQYIWQQGRTQKAPEAAPVPTRTPATGTPVATMPKAPQTMMGAPMGPPPSETTLTRLFSPGATQGDARIITTNPTAGNGFLVWLARLFTPKKPTAWPIASHPSVAPAPTPVGTIIPTTTEGTLRQTREQEAKVEQKLADLQKELATKSITEARLAELQKQLAGLLSDRTKMEGEMADLRKKLAQSQAPVRRPSPFSTGSGYGPLGGDVPYPLPPLPKAAPPRPMRPMAQPGSAQSTVNVISQDNAVRSGLPRLTTFPNVATGIVKDNQGSLLPGVLITVRDKEDVPLRALKTNKLGQFAASTPLPNGTYVVEVEDPRNRFVFDRAQITLTGSIAPALEIIAKSQRELTRQKLANELFGPGGGQI